MLARRIIPCLDVKDGRVVKGINFVELRDAGDPVEQAAAYDLQGADEVCFLDGGRVLEAFSPDFYLPDQDLYVEITVMKQSLVTRKNRKLRKLRERYPDVNIKLFYKRDIERLGQRYGLKLAS